MPETWLGATVNYYAGAANHEQALLKVVNALQADGMIFKELLGGDVIHLDPDHWWDGYVMLNYAEYSDYFPAQEEVLNIVKNGLTFHGPFAGWET